LVRRRALRRHRSRWSQRALPGFPARRRRGYRGSHDAAVSLPVHLRVTEPADLDALDPLVYEGLAYGAEFCPERLPRADQVLEAQARCTDAGISFTLVTPVLRQGAFDRVATWLTELAPRLGQTEWVVNDWGLLTWARHQGLPFRPVAGRLLGRQRRDPRMLEMVRCASPRDADGFRGSAWDDAQTRSLLTEYGIVRVELDLLLQGVRFPPLPEGVALSVCAPWIPVTLSPSCPWAGPGPGCGRECRQNPPVQLRDAETDRPLFSHGNTLFARSDDLPAPGALVKLGVTRLVWAEQIPG